MSMTRLCPRCADKLGERYETTAYTDKRAHCALCGSEGYVYEIEPKQPIKWGRRRNGPGYSAAERARYEKRRRWA